MAVSISWNATFRNRVRLLAGIEQEELASYEEIDDYLSFLNRLTRNLYVEAGTN